MSNSRRRNTFSSPALTAPKKKRKRKGASADSKAAIMANNDSSKNATIQRKQKLAEKREINKFTDMATTHMPTKEEVAAAGTSMYIIKLLLAILLRVSCSSRRDLKIMISSIMAEIASGDIFENELAMEGVGTRICGFLIGMFGIDVVSTLVPATFNQIKALRKFFLTWANDPDFLFYGALSVDLKELWRRVVRMRQQQSEKLKQLLEPKFLKSRSGKCEYETAIEKTVKRMSCEWRCSSELPLELNALSDFGTAVSLQLDGPDLLREWASIYGRDVPQKAILAIPAIISTRAEKRGYQGIFNAGAEVYRKVIEMRKSDEASQITDDDFDQYDDDVTWSQQKIFIPDTQEEKKYTGASRCIVISDSEEESFLADLVSPDVDHLEQKTNLSRPSFLQPKPSLGPKTVRPTFTAKPTLGPRTVPSTLTKPTLGPKRKATDANLNTPNAKKTKKNNDEIPDLEPMTQDLFGDLFQN